MLWRLIQLEIVSVYVDITFVDFCATRDNAIICIYLEEHWRRTIFDAILGA